MKTALIYDVERIFDVSIEPYRRKLQQASAKLGALLKVLENDSRLADPLDKNNPHYVCGDFLEELNELLSETDERLDYAHIVATATLKAWEDHWEDFCVYDEDGNVFDVAAYQREAFIQGYLASVRGRAPWSK